MNRFQILLTISICAAAPKPVLKVPIVTQLQRLKLQYDETLPNVAFRFNVRRYNEGSTYTLQHDEKVWQRKGLGGTISATRHVRPQYLALPAVDK